MKQLIHLWLSFIDICNKYFFIYTGLRVKGYAIKNKTCSVYVRKNCETLQMDEQQKAI